MSSEHGWQRHYPHSLSSFRPSWINHPSPYNVNPGGFIFAMTQINSALQNVAKQYPDRFRRKRLQSAQSHITSDLGHTGERLRI